jgi:hypothetical protein
MPRSYHGDAGLGENLDTAADIKNKRRVIDFYEARRIRRVVMVPRFTPAAAARAISSPSNSADFPVARDCADTA